MSKKGNTEDNKVRVKNKEVNYPLLMDKGLTPPPPLSSHIFFPLDIGRHGICQKVYTVKFF